MEPPPPAIGDLVADRYRLVSVVGRGGMGEVYEASDERLGRVVALKLLHGTDPTSAARLRAEALVLASLHHPNLITVHDAGEQDGRPFVVTELVHGTSLREEMAKGPLPGADAARIGAQIASALDAAHRRGVVHRDLTPANVLLVGEDHDVRLIDFGIAVSEHAPALTATGLVIGTPAYLSPEQVEGRTATPAADVYSLGLVLLEALQGRRVFPGTPTESAGARLVSDPVVPDELDVDWGPLIRAMTSRDPALRPTASQVAQQLGTWLHSPSPHPSLAPGSPPETAAVPATAAAEVATQPLAGLRADRGTTEVFDTRLLASTDGAGPGLDGQRRRRRPLVLALVALVAVIAVGVGALVLGADGRDAPDPSIAAETRGESTAVSEPATTTTTETTTTTTAPTRTSSPSTTIAESTSPSTVSGPDSGAPGPSAPQGADPPGADKGKGKGKP